MAAFDINVNDSGQSHATATSGVTVGGLNMGGGDAANKTLLIIGVAAVLVALLYFNTKGKR